MEASRVYGATAIAYGISLLDGLKFKMAAERRPNNPLSRSTTAVYMTVFKKSTRISTRISHGLQPRLSMIIERRNVAIGIKMLMLAPITFSETTMESLDYWRLCDEVSVVQAALLILGDDPTDKQYSVEKNTKSRPKGYEAARAALTHAILGGSLNATQRYELGEYTPCWHSTTVKVDELRDWLVSRGFRSGFFFPDVSEETPDYLSGSSPYYAPKLAAAVNAWLHVTKNLALLNGKTPKQAIEKWLREHAVTYGLTKEDGSPNEQGIEDIAKVANWKPTGGVAKTPSIHLATN